MNRVRSGVPDRVVNTVSALWRIHWVDSAYLRFIYDNLICRATCRRSGEKNDPIVVGLYVYDVHSNRRIHNINVCLRNGNTACIKNPDLECAAKSSRLNALRRDIRQEKQGTIPPNRIP